MNYNNRNLKVWVRSKDLAKRLYAYTERLPSKEQFCLTNQIRRAAVSVPSNIAEGSKRGTKKDFAHFLHIAYGSLAEIETQIIIAHEIYAIGDVANILQEIDEIQKMIHTLIKKM